MADVNTYRHLYAHGGKMTVPLELDNINVLTNRGRDREVEGSNVPKKVQPPDLLRDLLNRPTGKHGHTADVFPNWGGRARLICTSADSCVYKFYPRVENKQAQRRTLEDIAHVCRSSHVPPLWRSCSRNVASLMFLSSRAAGLSSCPLPSSPPFDGSNTKNKISARRVPRLKEHHSDAKMLVQ